ncbi:MAG TPA: hypothetical protein VF190_14600 [Rhodothermales bacterium]
MAEESRGLRVGLQVLLGIVIIVLGYVLFQSITKPYEAIEHQRELTRATRERMADVRTAMVRYERVHSRYPLTLDSLVQFVKTDSLIAVKEDSVFGHDIVPDSLPYSPRTGRMFELSVNDTARVKTYLLKDPDSDDQIGTIEADVTRLNAASWE